MQQAPKYEPRKDERCIDGKNPPHAELSDRSQYHRLKSGAGYCDRDKGRGDEPLPVGVQHPGGEDTRDVAAKPEQRGDDGEAVEAHSVKKGVEDDGEAREVTEVLEEAEDEVKRCDIRQDHRQGDV